MKKPLHGILAGLALLAAQAPVQAGPPLLRTRIRNDSGAVQGIRGEFSFVGNGQSLCTVQEPALGRSPEPYLVLKERR